MPSNSHQPGQDLKRVFLARLLANKMTGGTENGMFFTEQTLGIG